MQENSTQYKEKLPIGKQQDLLNYLQVYGRPGNLTTYSSDTVRRYLTKTQLTDGQRDSSSPSLRRVTRNSQELPRYNSYIHCSQDLQCSTTQPQGPKIEKILWKNQNGFRRNWSTTSQILTIHQFLKGVCTKNLEATPLLVDFSETFYSIQRGKMEQILLGYGIPKETVTAIMMLYKNTKVNVRSLDGDTDDFNNVANVLLGDTLSPCLFIICLNYVLRTSIYIMKDNGFQLAK